MLARSRPKPPKDKLLNKISKFWPDPSKQLSEASQKIFYFYFKKSSFLARSLPGAFRGLPKTTFYSKIGHCWPSPGQDLSEASQI